VKGNITLLPAALSSSLSPTASSLLWDHVRLHLQARRATHFLRVHVPPSGLEYSLLENRLLTQPAFMFRPPGFDDEEFRQKDRTQKNRITE
jgi:hypothetical protein